MLTYLAILFVISLIAAIVYGFGIVMRRPPTQEELSSERCTLCRETFPKDQLVERAVGDHRVLWFCGPCIEALERDRAAL